MKESIENLYEIAHNLKELVKYSAENSQYYTAKILLKMSENIEKNLKVIEKESK